MAQELEEDLILPQVQWDVVLAPGQPQAESGSGLHHGHPSLPLLDHRGVPHPLPWSQNHVQVSPGEPGLHWAAGRISHCHQALKEGLKPQWHGQQGTQSANTHGLKEARASALHVTMV